MTRTASRSATELGLASVIASVVVLSFGPIIVKDSRFDALAFLFWRLWAGVAITVPVLYLLGGRLDRRVLRASFAGGVIFALNAALFFTALKRTSVANATVISSTAPIVLFWVGWRFFGERARPIEVVATLCGIGGIALVVLGGGQSGTSDLLGDMLAIGAMLLFAAFLAASKTARVQLTTMEYTTGWTIWAAIVATPIALLSGQPMTTDHTLSWVLLVLIAGVLGLGHFLMAFAHGRVPLAVISVLNLANPLLSTVWAWFIFDERLVLLQFLGIAVVIASLSVVVLRSSS